MNLLRAALLLPLLCWAGAPQNAPEPTAAEKLQAPGITFRSDVASATREPWVNSNGWRYLRNSDGHFSLEAPGPSAALAAAEAFAFGGHASIHTDEAGQRPLAQMLHFLSGLPQGQYKPVVDIDFVDDGTPTAAECLNLLIRRNLLAEDTHAKAAAPHLQIVVFGSAEYPKKDAANPVVFAQQVRRNLTDEKRSLRIYGSSVVIGRLASDGTKTRVMLLNYGTGKYTVDGLRVRVAGHYAHAHLLDPELPANKLQDDLFKPDAAEFTLQKLKTFAVVELE